MLNKKEFSSLKGEGMRVLEIISQMFLHYLGDISGNVLNSNI